MLADRYGHKWAQISLDNGWEFSLWRQFQRREDDRQGDPSEGSCTAPANWRRERRLTTASFDILDAPIARGHFLGDYMGQAAAGMDLLPVFGLPDGVNETSIFTRRVSRATAVSSAAE